jgi:hypothetical protein
LEVDSTPILEEGETIIEPKIDLKKRVKTYKHCKN